MTSGHKESVPPSYIISTPRNLRPTKDLNPCSEMKGSGTPNMAYSHSLVHYNVGRTFLGVEPLELNTYIQYTHDVNARSPFGSMQGQRYDLFFE